MNPYFQTPNTQEEWNQAIILDGLHLKWHEEAERPETYPHSQLSKMLASFQSKKDLLSADIDSRTELAANGDLAAEADVESYWRLDKFIQLIEKEIEFRQNNVYTRSPIGTTYYVDPGSGNDGNAGTSTGAAWATIRQFIEGARSAGDICIVRRDATNMSDATFTTATVDGDISNPIICEADYDDAWGDFASSAQTYTIAVGGKSATASASITGISAGDWIYVSGDDARLHCLEVKSVSGSTLNFYLAYRGNNAGSGKSLTVMGPSPVNGSTSTGDLMYFNTALYWVLRGIHSKGAYGGGAYLFTNSRIDILNCTGEGTKTGTQDGAFTTGSYAMLNFRNFRALGGNLANTVELGHSNGSVVMDNCDIDGTGQGTYNMIRGIYAQAQALGAVTISNVHIHDVGNSNGSDIDRGGVGMDLEISTTLGTVRCKNVTFDNNSTGDIEVEYNDSSGEIVTAIFEDYGGTKGDTRMFSGNGPGERDSPWGQTDFTVARPGGAENSLKVTPSTNIGGGWTQGGYPLVGEHVSNMISKGTPIYLAAGTHTIKFYFKTENTTDWTANPTADELYIEAEFLSDASSVVTELKRSTDTLDFTSSTDWQSISIQVTTAQDGLVYLKMPYSKTKEASKTNIFWFDPHIEIS